MLLPLFQRYPDKFTPLKIIGSNFENFKSVDYGSFVVRDSFMILHTALANLVDQLRKQGERTENNLWSYFPHTKKWLQTYYGPDTGIDQAAHLLILKKGVYPYEYMTSLTKLSDASLPVHQAFFSALSAGNVSSEDYAHAQQVYSAFKCQTLRDYTDLYVASDVVLLADCLAHRRKIMYQTFKLDICHFMSLPSYAKQVVLKMTGIKLDYIKDTRMIEMIDRGVIGGVSMVDTSFFQANTPYFDDPTRNSTLLLKKKIPVSKLYNPKKARKDILTVDCNGLYSFCMTKPLPYKDFRWENPSIITDRFIQNYSDEDRRGLFVEVDLAYPRELHRTHDSFPCAPSHQMIPEKDLSPYQQEYLSRHNIKHATEHYKVIPNLYDKHNYVCHIKNLQQYVSLGLKLTKVHAVISFRQKRWLKTYIDLVTRLRQSNYQDPFAVAAWKLMMNVYYGKCIEDARKYREFKMFNTFEKLIEYVSKAEFVSARAYETNCGVVELKSGVPKADKPRYLGMAILAYAKEHIYDFHFNKVMKTFDETEVRLLMTGSYLTIWSDLLYLFQILIPFVMDLQQRRMCQKFSIPNLLI